MGNATTVCSDKTGTLTENKMSVVCANIANKQFDCFNDLKTRPTKSSAMNLAAENISVNSTAFEGKDADGQIRFIGSTTECAMLEFVTKLGYSYDDNRKSTRCAYVYPFNSTVKSMTTVIRTNDSNAASSDRSKYRVYTKGAPEMVIQACSHYLDKDDQVKPLNSYMRVDQEMLVNSYAGRSLRALALAYRDVDTETFNGKKKKVRPSRFLMYINRLSLQLAFHTEDPPLKNLVLIGIIGVQDKLRQGVVESVQEFRRAGVFVRMVK